MLVLSDDIGQDLIHAEHDSIDLLASSHDLILRVLCDVEDRTHLMLIFDRILPVLNVNVIAMLIRHSDYKFWKIQLMLEMISDQGTLVKLLYRLPRGSSIVMSILPLLKTPQEIEPWIVDPETPIIHGKTAISHYLKNSSPQALVRRVLPNLKNSSLQAYALDQIDDTLLLKNMVMNDRFSADLNIKVARKLQDTTIYLKLLQESDSPHKTNLLFTINNPSVLLDIIKANLELSYSTIAYFRLQRLNFTQNIAAEIAESTAFEPIVVGSLNAISDHKLLAKLRLAVNPNFQKYISKRVKELDL